MQLTITNDKITTGNGINLSECMLVEKVSIETDYLNTIDGKSITVGSKAVITAALVDTNIKADGTVLLSFDELSDDNLVYVMEELTQVMQSKGLVK